MSIENKKKERKVEKAKGKEEKRKDSGSRERVKKVGDLFRRLKSLAEGFLLFF